MARRWKDDLGDTWEVELFVEGDAHPETGEPLGDVDVLSFSSDDRTVSLFIRGELETLDQLKEGQLELAVEAARDGRGTLFLDEGGQLWWVRRRTEADHEDDGYPILFSSETEDLRHPGPLRAPADQLDGDELQVLVDEARELSARTATT